MLRPAKEFKTLKLRARDGDIGNVREFFFDDRSWMVRYMVADTGNWLTGRQVLISPNALKPSLVAEDVIPVDLTKSQIENSPALANHEPVSRQFEMQYYGYYGWPCYWTGAVLAGPNIPVVRNPEATEENARREKTWDHDLRSTKDATGHHIQALDGEIGHVADFIIDDTTWSIPYLVVDTKNWWPGKHVRIATRWITQVSWPEAKIFVNMTRETLKQSPEGVIP
jgi:hypothetical protein